MVQRKFYQQIIHRSSTSPEQQVRKLWSGCELRHAFPHGGAAAPSL
ncbi:MAG TPA: hypothetical protein PLR92_11225 [Alicycliphilus denitrificans]|nr:hypothetical protein [Alicycliphilus denitrificans]